MMSTFDDFYDNLQTLPKLISDLALSVSEAQRRMDVSYMNDLTAFLKIVASMYAPGGGAGGAGATAGGQGGGTALPTDQLMALFRTMMPSRYQFTETVVEVRADLQMTTGSEMKGTLGINVPSAVTVNASYTKRTATDYQAAALIRTVLNSVPADPAVMQGLLTAAQQAPAAALPTDTRYKALSDAFSGFNAAATPTTTPAKTGEKNA
jgi:hypothetical protein